MAEKAKENEAKIMKDVSLLPFIATLNDLPAKLPVPTKGDHAL